MKTNETKMTVSELREALKASRAKVQLHFTVKGNPAWRVLFRYGKSDVEIGSNRLTKREADERLAEFGLTANLVIEITKAVDEAQAAKTAAMKASGEFYTGGRNCDKLTTDEINAIYAKFAKADNSDDAEAENESAETAKFETGKTYAAKKSVLFDSQINMTVIKRTNCYVTIQFDEDEEDIRRCKIVDDAGVEKIYIHETNAISGDYEFSANDVAEETDIDEVKDDEPNRNMKLAAKIVNSLPGTLIFLGEGVTKNGKPTVSFDVENGTEISPMIRVTETFTDGTKSAIDYVEVTRDYAETKTAKHVRYYFADGGTDIDALTVLNDRVNDLLRRRDNVNANMRLLTNDEYAGKLAELDSELRYVEIQIGAIKAGDTFDYVDAAEHIKGVHEDVKTCIDLWTREHGLTVGQCEQIYVAAHVDRNFTAGVDRELINRMIDDFKRCNAADTVKAEFDKAVTESVNNYSATVEINGETLTFEDGQLAEVASLRYEAYFTIRDGRRNFYYRGNRVSKQDFFGHIAVEDKAIAERAAITEFVAKYGGSEFKPGTNPLDNFVAQIHPTLANGRQDNYFATFDSKADAHAFIDEFKTLAGDMKFIATIKRGSFYGEEIYRHGLNGQEYFAPDDEAEVLNANWKDAQRQLDKRITVEIQGGGTCAIDKDSDIRLTKIKDGYAFVDYGKIVAVGAKVVLGRYDTPAQVKEVIDKFGKSIFGNRFEFPHVEDVSKSDIEIAEELTAFLLKTVPWHAGFMDLTLQNGNAAVASPRTATIKPDWHGNGRFAFVTPWNEIFARYDTASQVRTVIYRIKHAVEDK
ncbi:MAG: hypothetical protein IJ774_00340, partial [Selenomonadaceae bacterium]|nr:hypothetical protein [Selenomonadaceae bacterium]